jgi:hypothetical protein
MITRRRYIINDGLDGVIVAKSLKHCAKILSRYNGVKVPELIENFKSSNPEADFRYYTEKTRERKSRFIGFVE